MKINKLNLILSSVVLVGVVAVMPNAYAQEAGEVMLEEIIVTAQKREQRVHDIAATVTAISGAHIDDYNILNFQDLERISAGLSLTQHNPRNVTIALRGVTFDPESGTSSAVDVYQNDVVQRPDNVFGAIYDISRVEVLRGAQGSLQGATSPAGAIILHTNKADLNEITGSLQSTYSDSNKGFNLQAAVSFPIAQDKLGFRIAFYRDENDGNNIRNITTGNVQDRDSTSFRASLLWKPIEDLELNLTYQNNDERILGTPALEGERTSANAFPTPGIPCAALAAVPTLDCVSLNRSANTALAANDAFANRKADVTTLNIDWTLGEHQLSYVFGKTKSSKPGRTENDASNNLPLLNFYYNAALMVETDTNYLTHQSTNTRVNADTHELRFASTDNPAWDYMVGFYYRNQKTTTRFDAWSTAARYVPVLTLNDPRNPVVFGGSGHVEGINFSTGGTIPFNLQNIAIFTAHNIRLGEKSELNVALRYQEVERFNALPIAFSALNQEANITAAGEITAMAPIPDPSSPAGIMLDANGAPILAPLPDPAARGAAIATVLGGIRATNIEGIPVAQQRPKSDALTGSLSFQHAFSDDFNAYISWNRAFREGGISAAPGEELSAADLLFGDETSDSFELGTKIGFLDGRGEINIALFHQMFDGFLGYVTDLTYIREPGADGARGRPEEISGGLVYNADATFTGLDLDWRVIFTNYQMGGSVSWVEAKFDNASVPCNVRTGDEQLGRCISNRKVPGSPELSANLFAEYSVPLGTSATQFFVRGNAKYNGGIIATRATSAGDDPGKTSSFVLVDLFLGFNHEDWEVFFWSKNLFNDRSLLDLTNPGDDFDVNGDFSIVRAQQRRTFGLTGRFSF